MRAVSAQAFLATLRLARSLSARIEAATSSPDEITGNVSFVLADDGLSGYGVTDEGTLVAVFSLIPGRGDALVLSAIENGATNLDCFDGYLPTLYGRHGFTETGRVPNWTPGAPDVVFMSL